MSTDSYLKIVVDADGRPAVAGINDARTAVTDLGAAADASAAPLTAMAGNLLALGAGTFAISELVGMVQGWIAASAEAARASAMLDAAIQALPGGTQEQAEALKELAGATQALTGTDGDALVQAQARLAQQRLSVEAIGLLTPLMVDASEAARQMGAEDADLAGVAKVVGKAYTDSASALRRYGVALTDVEVAQIDSLQGMDRASAIAEVMSRQFGGLAQTLAGTFDGASRSAAQATGDLAEALGDLITKSPDVVDGLSGYTDSVRAATGFVSEHAGAIRDVAGDVGLVALVAALGMAAQKSAAWVSSQREASAATAEQADAQRSAAATEVAAAGRKELSARANQTLARAAVAAAKGEHAMLSAQLLQNPSLATNKEFMDRLTASRKAAEIATKNLRAADLALTGALGGSAAAAQKAAASAAPLAASWKEIGSVGGALNGIMAAMIGYDVGKWMREAAADAEAWYNPLTLVRAGLEGLDKALQSNSETYRQLREAEQDHADRLEKEAEFLKRVSEQSGVTVTSLSALKEAVASGAIVQNQATGAWEKGTQALRALAGGLGNLDTAYVRATEILDGYAKRQDAVAKANAEKLKAAAATAKAAGDEPRALQLVAKAQAEVAQVAEAALQVERATLATMEERSAALVKQLPADDAAREARTRMLATLTDEIEKRRAAVTSAEAQVATAKAEAAQARIVAETFGDQSAELGTLLTARDKLTRAIKDGADAQAKGTAAAAGLADAEQIARETAERYTAVLMGQATGDLPALESAAKAAQARVTELKTAVDQGAAAAKAAGPAADALAQANLRIADAARDAAQKQDMLISKINGEAQVTAMGAETQLADLQRRQAMASALGRESDAREFGIEILRKEVEIARISAEVKAAEADGLREKARLLTIAAEADGRLTLEEQAQVQQAELSAKLAGAEADKLRVVTATKEDAITITQELAAQQRALADEFAKTGAAGVDSVESVRQAISAAASGAELDQLGKALEATYARGVLSAEQYQAALDEIAAKQSGLAAGGSGRSSTGGGAGAAQRRDTETVTLQAPSASPGGAARTGGGVRTGAADTNNLLAAATAQIAELRRQLESMRPLRVPYTLAADGADSFSLAAAARGSRT